LFHDPWASNRIDWDPTLPGIGMDLFNVGKASPDRHGVWFSRESATKIIGKAYDWIEITIVF
jgi:hypothetical protein